MLLSSKFDTLRTRSAEVRNGGTFIRSAANTTSETKPQNVGLNYDIDLMLSAQGDALVAVFRYSEVTDALKTASMRAQRILADSGFAFLAFDSGIPKGYFLSREIEERDELLETFLKALEAADGAALDWGTFDLDAFLLSLEVAQPLNDLSLIAYPQSVRTVARKNRRAFQHESRVRELAYLVLSLGLGLLAYVFAKTVL